jgi:hypothetical protein
MAAFVAEYVGVIVIGTKETPPEIVTTVAAG